MVEETPYDEIIDETCPSCRHTVPQGTTVCPNCGYQIREEPKKAPAPKKGVPASVTRDGLSKPEFGGVLIIVSGILAIVNGLYWLMETDTAIEFYESLGLTLSSDIVVAWSALTFIFGIIALIGGIMAYRKKSWGIAVVGGFLGFLASGGLFLGTILGLVGAFVVAISKKEFKS